MYMGILNKLLLKSNSYNYYKNNYEELVKKNEELNNQLISVQNGLDDYIQTYKNVVNEEKYIVRECNCCGTKLPFFVPFNRRLQGQCPKCASLERTRLICYYFEHYTEMFSKNNKLLHFAPEIGLHKIFSSHNNIDYYPVDIDENRPIRMNVNMCDIPFKDNTFDYIFASHVLEHILDDKKAMSELFRVVKSSDDGGKVFLMVPIFFNLEETFENPEYNTDELRLKYFGQEDHVRKYACDFVDRLKDVGFNVTRFNSRMVEKDIRLKYGFSNLDKEHDMDIIFICEKE